MDLFERCEAFYSSADYGRTLGYPANPRTLEALGLYPYFIPIEEPDGTEVVVEGRRLIMLGSNNYLGLTSHPAVKEAASAAIGRYGSGCTGSRFLNGTLELHLELEERLARFVGKEKALVFATGFQANLGSITALVGRGHLVVADREVHASVVDAIRMAQSTSGARARFFRHGDLSQLQATLETRARQTPTLVIVDGVYSMGGDTAPLPAIAALCREHGARLMVDDAHGIGVLGLGRGTSAHFGCTAGVDLIMGTFSKSLASIGGFVAGSRAVIHWIQHFARPFIFSASLPPANVATVLAALDIVESEPQRVKRVNQIAAAMRQKLRAAGFHLGKSATPIVPLIVGDQFRSLQAWRALIESGVYTNVALPPGVPSKRSLLRTSYMATHTDDQLERVFDALIRVRDRILPTGREDQRRRPSSNGAQDVNDYPSRHGAEDGDGYPRSNGAQEGDDCRRGTGRAQEDVPPFREIRSAPVLRTGRFSPDLRPPKAGRLRIGRIP
jgi:8-amino-7-oxononanoate synthase